MTQDVGICEKCLFFSADEFLECGNMENIHHAEAGDRACEYFQERGLVAEVRRLNSQVAELVEKLRLARVSNDALRERAFEAEARVTVLEEVERKAIAQSEYIQAHGLTEFEMARLKAWVDDLQSGMYVNCVYCGHRYGPGETTPVSMADALKAHIETCSKHPMSALKKRVGELETALAEAEERIEAIKHNAGAGWR